jgi:Ca2+-binding RTX toxin-like protein
MTFPCGAPASKTVVGGVTHITGTNGVNYLCGTSGLDVIVAKGGGDWITGKGGKDTLEGGPGNGTVDNDSFCSKGDGAQDKLYGGVPGKDSGKNDRARVDLTLDVYKPRATYGIEVYN